MDDKHLNLPASTVQPKLNREPLLLLFVCIYKRKSFKLNGRKIPVSKRLFFFVEGKNWLGQLVRFFRIAHIRLSSKVKIKLLLSFYEVYFKSATKTKLFSG